MQSVLIYDARMCQTEQRPSETGAQASGSLMRTLTVWLLLRYQAHLEGSQTGVYHICWNVWPHLHRTIPFTGEVILHHFAGVDEPKLTLHALLANQPV